jgi:hypothetical protein
MLSYSQWMVSHTFSILAEAIYQYRTPTKFYPYKGSQGLFVP